MEEADVVDPRARIFTLRTRIRKQEVSPDKEEIMEDVEDAEAADSEARDYPGRERDKGRSVRERGFQRKETNPED